MSSPRGLEATALIDGDIDHDGPGLHPADKRAADEFGRRCTGDKHPSNDESRLDNVLLDRVPGREDRVEWAPELRP